MSDPTDPGGVSANAERSRSTRVGDSGSPVGSPLTIVLALIAVVVGFLIFRSIDDSDAGGIETPDGSTTVAPGVTTTVAGATTATTAAPATTPATRVTEGATVIVANASAAGGVAAKCRASSRLLATRWPNRRTRLPATRTSRTSSSTSSPLRRIQAVAQSVARDLGGLTVSRCRRRSPSKAAASARRPCS